MRGLSVLISRMGVLLVMSMILIFFVSLFASNQGENLFDMYERGPGYIAMNIVLTLDSASAAPENTIVTYDFEHTEDINSLYLDSGCKPNEYCKVAVSRYGKCEEMFKWSFEALNDVRKFVQGGTERVGRCIVSLGRSCEKKEKTTSSHRDAILTQMRAASYRRPSGVTYETEPESCIELTWDFCDMVAASFEKDHFYLTPKNIKIENSPENVNINITC